MSWKQASCQCPRTHCSVPSVKSRLAFKKLIQDGRNPPHFFGVSLLNLTDQDTTWNFTFPCSRIPLVLSIISDRKLSKLSTLRLWIRRLCSIQPIQLWILFKSGPNFLLRSSLWNFLSKLRILHTTCQWITLRGPTKIEPFFILHIPAYMNQSPDHSHYYWHTHRNCWLNDMLSILPIVGSTAAYRKNIDDHTSYHILSFASVYGPRHALYLV